MQKGCTKLVIFHIFIYWVALAIQIPFYDKKIAKTTCRGNDMTFFIVFKQGFEEIASHFDIANKYKMHFLRLKSSNHLLYGTEHSFEFSML